MTRWILLFSLIIFNTYGATNVIWPIIESPPQMVIHKDGKRSGCWADLQKLMINNLKDMKHITLELPINRVKQYVLNGQNVCMVGLNKTKKREEIFVFSKPYGMGNRHDIIYSSRVKKIFEGKHAYNLEKLIRDYKLKLIIKKEVSYGPYVDGIIEKYRKTPQIVVTQNAGMGDIEIQMLLKNRGDITIGLLATHYYLNLCKNKNLFGIAEISGGDQPNAHHIACTKNKLGKRLIERINRILSENIHKQEFYKMMNFWVRKCDQNEFRKLYSKLVLKEYK